MRPSAVGRFLVLWGWAVAGVLCAGCATVGGRIPPTAFQFYKTVQPQGGDGGWKVAQITITLTRVSRTQPLVANCQVEIGVPQISLKGAIPDVVAQEESATASDAAARFALGQRPATSAELCQLFMGHLRQLLSKSLQGSRVRGFVETGIPQTTFEPE